MIKNIVFDMGRVLIRFQSEYIMESMKVPKEYRGQIRKALFHSEGWLLSDAGAISQNDVIALACRELEPALYGVCADVYMNFHRYMDADPLMYEVVRELKQRGYGIYLCSNANERFREYAENIPALSLFDGMIVSAEEKCIKPGRRIYQTLFERYSLKPQECFFIDDMQANIDGARAAGMQGYCYADGNVERLREYLKQIDVL